MQPMQPMRRTIRDIRFLALFGAAVLAFGLLFVSFMAAAVCVDSCPTDSELAATIAARIVDAAPLALISAAPAALAWVLCLVQFARAGRWGPLAALALALPLVAILALVVLYTSTGGYPLPTTWAMHSVGWDATFQRSLLLLLLWPGATFVASFALSGR
jgi:hypothetical protein